MPDEATVGAFPQPPDPLPPPDTSKRLFFTSHATAEDNEPFKIFYRDLSADVGQLVPRWRVDVGFLDRRMETGVGWEHEILDAVGNCQVFVALLSVPFYSRPFCGKEVDAFARRRTWRRSDRALMNEPKCILPVIWAPTKREPAAISRLQRFSPDAESETVRLYLQHGVYGLQLQRDDRRNGSHYRTTVWTIALEIQRLVDEYWVEPDVPADSKCLRNVFDEGV